VKQTFGFDSEMQVKAFSKKNEYVPKIDADYKFDIKDNSFWEKEYLLYEETFKNDEKVAVRHEKVIIFFKILNEFRYHRPKKGFNISFDNFAYFLTKQLLNSKEKIIKYNKSSFPTERQRDVLQVLT
jgi:hypothetical protein